MYVNSAFVLLIVAGTVSCRIFSVENADGSYSIGHSSDSQGQTGNSVFALLTKGQGYTINNGVSSLQQRQEAPQPEPETRGLLTPHLEILELVEAFLRFKGEVGSRLYSLLRDNSDLIQSLYSTLISKLGHLHNFTLFGIQILRKVLLFANSLMAQWQINIPAVDFSGGINTQTFF